MRYPIFRTIYSSIPVGGGGRGTAAGTVHAITTGDGLMTISRRFSIVPFRPGGRTITAIRPGKDTDGNTEK